jgi:hypothetical protein
MRAPLMRITIGDYLYRVAGLLENVNVSVEGISNWEIDSIEDDTDLRQLPRVVDINCTFKPIQDFLPRRETIDNQNVPYISEYKTQDNWLDIPIQNGTPIATVEQNKLNTSLPSTNIKAPTSINPEFKIPDTVTQNNKNTIQASANSEKSKQGS